MYFPVSAARQLSTVPPLPNIPPEPTIAIRSSPRKSLFCAVTRNGIAVWLLRPPALLADLTRTPSSILDHGENLDAWWSPDTKRIIIQTTESYLVLVTVEFKLGEHVYCSPALQSTAQRNFLPGPGEGIPMQAVSLQFEGVIHISGTLMSISPRKHYLLFSTCNPSTVQKMPWPFDDTDGTPEDQFNMHSTWLMDQDEFAWLVEPEVSIQKIVFSRSVGGDAWITSDGRVYLVQLFEETATEDGNNDIEDDEGHHNHHSVPFSTENQLGWHGTCVHDFQTPKWVQKQRRIDPDSSIEGIGLNAYEEPRRASVVAINRIFSLIAVGTHGGTIELVNFPSHEGIVPKSQTIDIPNPYNRQFGTVCALEWSSDGYVLAVGWKCGWGIFSVGGRCLASGFGVDCVADDRKFQDIFMHGVRDLFWAPGNFELVVLAQCTAIQAAEGQLFVIPFAKSATTGQHSPDNTRYAFLQMDDRALIYRGADQPDMSIINPESDVWQHIKIPQKYISVNWPIRFSSLSSDGRLVAIAGRKGLIHYSSASGRWKMFADEQQEQAFVVKGGMVWFHHVLIAALEIGNSHQIRLFSRDMELTSQNILYREVLSSPVVIMSLVDNSLLVYTLDNTLLHYLVVPTSDTIRLHLCGSIAFTGIIAAPNAVRMLSWMIPAAQKQLGDPVDDLAVATVLMVVGGQLILLRPRKSADQEVKYDMQIFADRIEFCWIHLRGIGSLENSLWAYDAKGMRVWLNALAIEAPQSQTEVQQNVKESVNIPLDFYPLSVLMDKGIIIGAEHETIVRSNLPFVMFRYATNSHLFLQHIILYHLESRQIKEAVAFAAHYKSLVFFAHALEVLLHTVAESETGDSHRNDDTDSVLEATIEFLDHFDVALDVVVGCARKTEVTRWRKLFDAVGNPKVLFEACLASQRLHTAGSYLLVLHNLEQLDENNTDAARLLKSAVQGKEWQLCRELLRFLHSIDDTGEALRNAISQLNVSKEVLFLATGNDISH